MSTNRNAPLSRAQQALYRVCLTCQLPDCKPKRSGCRYNREGLPEVRTYAPDRIGRQERHDDYGTAALNRAAGRTLARMRAENDKKAGTRS